MSYEQLEQHIYENDIRTYDILTALHPFYRYKIYQITAEKCRLSLEYDVQELALNVIRMMGMFPKDVIENFEIASFSYSELLSYQRILSKKSAKKVRLSRKANRARVEIRRNLKINRIDDEVQKDFDENKKLRYQHLKYNERSVQDSLDRKTSNNRKRDWMISCCLESSMRIACMTQDPCSSGWFLSLTLPKKYHGLSFEQANDEINRRLNMIKKYAERYGIDWSGISVVELHKDETPHLHIIYFVNNEKSYISQKTDRDQLLDIVFKFFDNEDPEKYELNQNVTDFEGVLGYIFKDYGKPNTRHGFIGLRRDIRRVWNNLYIGNYGDPSLSYLSSDRLFNTHRLMKKNSWNDVVDGIPGYVLFSLYGFKSDYLNNIGKNDEPIRWVGLSRVILKMRKCINFSYKTVRNLLLKIIRRSYVTDFGYSYIYINTYSVFYCISRFETIKSKGQPPPERGDWMIFKPLAGTY
ncbi:replication endonuclease [Gluconobacter sp. Dm-62]|uniref:replication endonuclease n=1 Tax=Gluconobacter sp. Dm-62 TaxID=2799804 RepID=UPI001B8D74E2|nr:replication endonuclease [Gluconobacter sp. Dm-62]MBS1104291.1 replication endonuclease [Gluconobacter sp. Dm-62]